MKALATLLVATSVAFLPTLSKEVKLNLTLKKINDDQAYIDDSEQRETPILRVIALREELYRHFPHLTEDEIDMLLQRNEDPNDELELDYWVNLADMDSDEDDDRSPMRENSMGNYFA